MLLTRLLLLSFFLLLICSTTSAQPLRISSLPDSIYKVYKKLIKKSNKKVHFRENQKEILEELLVLRWLKIKETEARLYPDTKMIYKELRFDNYRFWDNMKDMMTARQWGIFGEYMEKYEEKMRRKNEGKVLSYYELWKY